MGRLVQRIGLTRHDADTHYKKALQAYQKRLLSDAILEMERAIDLLPQNSEYYAARGFFYLEDGLVKEAETDFDQALKLYKLETLAHYGKGIIAYKARKWDDALAAFTQAYRSAPDRPETSYYLALAHHHKGENGQALVHMQRALGLFEAGNDKRKADATKWVKQLEKLEDQRRLNPVPPTP